MERARQEQSVLRVRESPIGSPACRPGEHPRPSRPGWWGRKRGSFVVAGAIFLFAPFGLAQQLRFANHREVAVPRYATLRIGPFYSTALFTQTAGYTYTRSSGTGTDYLFRNRRGQILKDGSEFPLISTLGLRNYLLITRRMDLDASLRATYECYPLDTQEDIFYVDLVEEGVIGELSMEIECTPYLKVTLYDDFLYRTDYVDTRGWIDPYGGDEYEYLRNTFGADLDWLIARNQNLGLSASRTDVWPQDRLHRDQKRVTYAESALYEYALGGGVVLGARARFEQTDYASEDRSDVDLQEYTLLARLDRTGREGIRLRLSEMSVLSVGIGYAVGAAYATGRRVVEEREGRIEGEGDRETLTGFITLETQLRKDLRHELGYAHTLRGGFASAFEEADEYHYTLTWQGAASSAQAYARLLQVNPSGHLPDYRNRVVGAEISYLLLPPVTLRISGQHAERDNETPPEVAGFRPEDVYDYRTWFVRAGTSFALTRKLEFYAYAQHAERESASGDLDYQRDQIGALFTYTHQF